jgi:hypothetical protein
MMCQIMFQLWYCFGVRAAISEDGEYSDDRFRKTARQLTNVGRGDGSTNEGDNCRVKSGFGGGGGESRRYIGGVEENVFRTGCSTANGNSAKSKSARRNPRRRSS